MALFFITAQQGSEAKVEETLKLKFTSGIYTVAADKWLLQTDSVTAKEVFDKFGLPSHLELPGGGFLVIAVGGVYGLAAPDLWEWMKAQQPKT